MIVVDASVVLAALLGEGEARTYLATERLAVPHLVDVEVAHVLRRKAMKGIISDADARRALRHWAMLGVDRYPAVGLLDRVWDLRHNLTAYDATYVALAEVLTVPLVTADVRLAAATGPTCTMTVVRS